MISPASPAQFLTFTAFISMLAAAAIYCILTTKNLIRILIGVELLTKAVTLLIILGGYVTARPALAQALVIALIIVEVVVIAVAAGLVIGIFRHNGSLDTRNIKNLKG
jgi:NADH:ubiquinone oxidoreductase subunit K